MALIGRYLVCTFILFFLIVTTEERLADIAQVLDHLHQLLSRNDPIMVDEIDLVFDKINKILTLEQDEVVIPGELLPLLKELGARVDLNGSFKATTVRDNIALLMADTTPEKPVIGIVLASRNTDTFTEDSFSFLPNINSSILSMNVSEVVVSLPLSVTRIPRRINFVVFRDSRAFNYDREYYFVNSRVIGINIDNFEPEEYEVVDVHLQPIRAEPNLYERRVCTNWNALKDGTGYWSQEGCTLFKSNDPWMLDLCRCNHVTHLVEVVIPHHEFVQHDNLIIKTLAIIGSMLSILAIIIIALTAVLFRSWRKNFRHCIWLQLCVALFLLSFCYLIMMLAWYDQYSISCMINGMVLYFSILASYCWMLTVAFKACSELYLPPDSKPGLSPMLLASVFSWGVPIVTVIILGHSSSHMEPFEDMHSFSKFCKPSGTYQWLSFFTPRVIIIIIMIINCVLLFFVIYKLDIAPSNNNEEISDSNRDTLSYTRVGLGLVLLSFLPPWMFGLFTYNIVGIYLYTCTMTTQGLILFFFIICGDPIARKLWLHKLKLRRQSATSIDNTIID